MQGKSAEDSNYTQTKTVNKNQTKTCQNMGLKNNRPANNTKQHKHEIEPSRGRKRVQKTNQSQPRKPRATTLRPAKQSPGFQLHS